MQAKMTLGDSIKAFEALLDEFAFRSGGGDGEIVEKSVAALKFLRDFQQDWEVYYAEDVARPVYELTREALRSDDPEKIQRVILQFERIVEEEDCYLPIQKAFLLWESSVISLEQLIIFLESAYKLASKLRGKNEAVRWMANLLWRLTRC